MTDSRHKVFISYIGDLTYTPPDDVLLVEHDEDYVRACQKLSDFENAGVELIVWVRSKNHFAWLRDFTKQINCLCNFDEKTARLVLAEHWNVRIPDWLTDKDVVGYNLLDLPVDSQKHATFEERLMTHLLGPVFQLAEINGGQIVDVIKSLVSDQAKAAFRDCSMLRRCLLIKCEQWAAISTESWLRDICKRLPEDPEEIWKWLSLWAGLKGYPQKLLEYVLAAEQVLLVRKIPSDALNDMPLESTAKVQMLNQIDFFFKEIQHQITSSEDFQKVVRSMSGKLLEEYHIISTILKSNQFSATEDDVQAVQTRFKYCPGLSESQIKALAYCVRPERPTLIELDEDWSFDEWIRWTVEEYVAYRTWQVYNDYFDEDLEQTVARFTNWYIGEYTSIHKDPVLSLAYCLRPLSSKRSDNEFSLVLLADCLPLSFVNLLDNTLCNAGFSRHDLHYRFAALPTATEYNKAMLLSGEWHAKARNYETILKARGVADWGGRRVLYLSSLKSLSEMTPPEESTIAVLNFVEGDELLHSDVESMNTTYEEELYRLFSRVAEALRKASEKWTGPREHFNLYVVTDHGACRILEQEKRSFDSKVVSRLFPNEKHRFSAVPEDQIDKIPENLWLLGHRFRQPFSSDENTYFLPNGHNTVRQPGRVKGHMHGGVTPEEVIVPVASYKLVEMAWETPAARFVNLDLARETSRARFYVQRVVMLEVEMQNPNAVEIRILRASVRSPETDLKSCEVPVIPAKSVNTIQMSCYFQKAALLENSLEIEIVYEIAGQQHTFPITVECEFKSAMAGGFSLRDL